MIPSHRLLARAFRRVPLTPITSQAGTIHCRSPSSSTHTIPYRRSISTSPTGSWEGRKAKDHTARETDSHNVQQDAVREGKNERAESSSSQKEEGTSRGTSEKAGDSMDKAKQEFPEAPDVAIGMQDERGGKQ